MKVNITSPEDDIRILSINGHVDASNAKALEDEFEKIIADGKSKIVVNFKEVAYISSAGLRVFLSVVKKLKTLSGELMLCEMSENVNRIFKLAGFTRIFRIVTTEDESLAHLAKG